ncbi:hypothetical protein FJQ98_15945 [Lysinibacillus agricola]|uniref:Phosphoadenosine phosphosulphate reductase domain-containing protein n=1 Tax=Lysinibacillus agricola TaxID=2590012 RepID=A0ABX7ALG6_9BACI|nr:MULTISPECIES: hypothetical protein [Lysinibacillus]QQP10737.1 hypothetical protein FJQ98_15945 [Lysinibacillus agricola]
MFSTGAGSAWLTKYVVDKYGKENTIILITDTKWEDEDNYRFMKEVADYIGIEITEKSDGRTPEDIFRKDLYFGNFGTAPCSKELKMKQTFLYIQELIEQGILPILYFGIDYKEARRAPRLAYNYKHNVDVFEDGVELRFPLIAEIDGEPVNGKQLIHNRDFLNSDKMPKVYNKEIYESLESQGATICTANPKHEIENNWGIKLPRMYSAVEEAAKDKSNMKANELLEKGVKGFSHANCGGICVKGGMGHYSVLYAVWEDRYLKMEKLEREINDAQIAKNGRRYTILSKLIPTGELDEKGKEKKKKVPYSLEEYRLEVLEGDINSNVEVEENTIACECVF